MRKILFNVLFLAAVIAVLVNGVPAEAKTKKFSIKIKYESASSIKISWGTMKKVKKIVLKMFI